LGDSEALEVTGVTTGRVHYVHRPTVPRRELCFPNGVMGRDSHTIRLKMTGSTYEGPSDADLTLALHIGLDDVACRAVGLDYRAVIGRRSGGGTRAAAKRA
jgi:hypothetical protein